MPRARPDRGAEPDTSLYAGLRGGPTRVRVTVEVHPKGQAMTRIVFVAEYDAAVSDRHLELGLAHDLAPDYSAGPDPRTGALPDRPTGRGHLRLDMPYDKVT